MTEIRNINDGTFNPNNPMHVYVGRAAKFEGKWLKASPFSNPFKVKKHTKGEHIEAVRKYYEYVKQQPELIARIRKELRGKTLYCWCKPLPCHGDLLVLLADSTEIGAKDITGDIFGVVEETCDFCSGPVKEGGQPMHFKTCVGWRSESGAFHDEAFSVDFTLCSNQCAAATEILVHTMLYEMTDYYELLGHLVEYHGLSKHEFDEGMRKLAQSADKEGEDVPRLLTKINDAGRITFLQH